MRLLWTGEKRAEIRHTLCLCKRVPTLLSLWGRLLHDGGSEKRGPAGGNGRSCCSNVMNLIPLALPLGSTSHTHMHKCYAGDPRWVSKEWCEFRFKKNTKLGLWARGSHLLVSVEPFPWDKLLTWKGLHRNRLFELQNTIWVKRLYENLFLAHIGGIWT